MIKSKLSFFFFFLLLYNICAQTTPVITENYIDTKLEEIRFDTKISDSEKEKELSKLKKESEKIGYKWGILKSGRRIIEVYESQSKNKEIVKLATELKKIDAGPQADRTMANLYRSNALALGYLGFDEAGLKDFKTAIQYAKKIDDSDIRNYTIALCYEQMTIYFFNKRLENKSFKDSVTNYHNKSLESAKLIKEGNQEITTQKKYSLISFNHIRLGISYLEEADKPGNIENAEKHLMQSLNTVNKYNLVEADKVLLLNQLSWLYLEKKDYKKTIEYANKALDLEKKFPDPDYRVESLEFLASAYTELGDTGKSKFYMTRYTNLKDSIRIVEKNDADHAFNHLLTDSKKTDEKKLSFRMIVISLISLLLLVLITLYWKRKNKILHNKYDDLISKNDLIDDSNRVNIKPNFDITDKSIKNLLKELDKFEQSEHYLNKEITLNWMANHLNTNARYLSEIIKTYKNKIFTKYIDSLKINYIIKKLLSDPEYREHTLDVLAEKSGYDSKKNFAASFRAETKISPAYFIRNIKKDNYFIKDLTSENSK